jgi:hypothetical protein
MNRTGVLILAVVVVAFLAIGGFLIFRNSGGGGQNVTIDLKVAGSSMTPDSPSAKQNDTLTIRVTTDKTEEIHLHGYDIKFAGKPGQTITQTFKADKSGQFEIEIEDTSTHLGSLTVRP